MRDRAARGAFDNATRRRDDGRLFPSMEGREMIATREEHVIESATRRRVAVIACAALLGGCVVHVADEPPDTEQRAGDEGCDVEAPTCAPDGELAYSHPLQGVEAIEEQYPFVDLKHSGNGQVYALMEGGHGNEDGDYVSFGSGVVELVRREITEDERSEIEAQIPAEEGEYEHHKIGPRLQAQLEDLDPDEGLPVRILAKRPVSDTAMVRLHRAIAEGRVETVSDSETVRAEIMGEIAAETAEALAPVLATLSDRGITPDHIGDTMTIIDAVLDAGTIDALAEREDIVRLDPAPATVTGGADGQERAESMQYRLFWDESYTCGGGTCNYDGENGIGNDIHVAVVDPFEFHDEHVAFRESTSTTSERIAAMYDCNGVCVAKSDGDWSPPEGEHGTHVLGALVGDYRDGQDSNVNTTAARELRSAAGGEARVYLYEGDVADLGKVLDHADGLSPLPHFVVSSMGDAGVAPDLGDCNGDTTLDGYVDQLFENGGAYRGRRA